MTDIKTWFNGHLVEHEINDVAQPHQHELAPWPLLLQPLKLLAQSTDKGAGDIIERTIGPLGGDAFKLWYKTTFGRECGCNTRKEHWNNRYPLKP